MVLFPLTSEKFVRVIERCLFYAQLAQNRKQAALIIILNELDRIAGEFARRIHSSSLPIRDSIFALNQDFF
jgi:hypothetical protein